VQDDALRAARSRERTQDDGKMYGDRPIKDAVRYWRARATNLLAAAAPGLYVRMTGETGRGRAEASVAETAAYFARCAVEQDERLRVAENPEAFFEGKFVVEYGPGDCPGLALEMIGRGAATVACVDRFPLSRAAPFAVAVLSEQLRRMTPERRDRAAEAFRTKGDPASGFAQERVRYLVKADGLSNLRAEADLVCSRAVLEHANDLMSTYVDMARALKPSGVAAHLVDLKSHGLHRVNPLDFLTWPEASWRKMYGAKGAPNRHRVDVHRDAARAAGLREIRVDVVDRAPPEVVDEVRPKLDARFRTLQREDLEVLGFWILAIR
jgi:SAM-dependent methyltransferase